MTPTVSTQFAYVRGNPDNLVGAGDADMGDIQGPFYDIEDYLNSGILDLIARSGLIIGEVRFLAVASRPSMWQPCDGASKERALFPELFSAISTTYGPGAVPGSTFAVPDLRGRVMAGTGATNGTGTAHVAGEKFGAEVLLAAQSGVNGNGATGVENNDHSHTYTSPHGHLFPATIDGGSYANVAGDVAGANVPAGTSGVSVNHLHYLQARNADQAHWQPSLAVPAYIYAGAEP